MCNLAHINFYRHGQRELHQPETCEEFSFFIWLDHSGISSLGEQT